ncbi:DeoR/GlpR family DNA-binding transcription regulator [Pseudobacillus sp. FSL P4-0506]|uniref:DeoR/GlpR family DNA-binding transcription regulator n=1 Tax=unclassified Pseudobacillus TaxID=2619284 RepID=UPI0030F9A1B3
MNKSLLSERHKIILRELDVKIKVNVMDLALKLNVTPETIRKDLSALEEKKKLRRIHGGAVKYAGISNEPDFNHKVGIAHHQKQLIGEVAASFIKDGETIALDAGSTTLHVANSIKHVRNVTIVTNSLAAAVILNNRLEANTFNGKVIILGGTSNPQQRSISGSITNQLLEYFYFDKAFISCGGISQEGICDFDVDEATASSIIIKRSKQIYVVADSSKFNQRALFHIDSLSSIDVVISDQEMPTQWSKDASTKELNWIKTDEKVVF